MNIGANIRDIRKKKNMTLKAVSEFTKLSIPFLSQLETNKSDATLASLRVIADALGVHPSQFFYEQTTLNERHIIENPPFLYEQLTNETKASFVPVKVTLAPGSTKQDSVTHEGYEFVYCLKGTLTLIIEQQILELNAGETHMFDATKPHYWYNYTNEDIAFLVVNGK